MLGMSLEFVARKGSMSWPNAPPKGFARLMIAVADTLPLGLNHKSEYLVGAESTKGCAKPMSIWPTIVSANEGGEVRVPA